MRRLCDLELKVATAESCTGGLFASLLTDIEGCGHGFDRGFVTYSEVAKQAVLGLPPELTGRNSAVTADVARAMAESALACSEADIVLSVTGFAGPAGDSKERRPSSFRLRQARQADRLARGTFRGDRSRPGADRRARGPAPNNEKLPQNVLG